MKASISCLIIRDNSFLHYIKNSNIMQEKFFSLIFFDIFYTMTKIDLIICFIMTYSHYFQLTVMFFNYVIVFLTQKCEI
ncbi:hypothetical protein B6D60_06545 [candidate division KSB1 bacterium 4484_87]|nr:MAG: hypothetical protein B6D60_06545 [candidate division KSB1 bacterium 4484_87]